jgi:ATP-binding cassette subfamily B protein
MSALTPSLVAASLQQEEREPEHRPLQWRLLRRLFAYMWRYPWLQAAIVAQAFVMAALITLPPTVLTETIRWTIEQPERWVGATGFTPTAGLALGAAIIACLGVVFYFFFGWRVRCVNRLNELVVVDLRRDLHDHILRLDMAFFDRTRLGRILSRGTSDIASMRAAVAQVIPRTLIQGLSMLFFFAAMVRHDWILAAWLLLFAPLIIFFNKRLGRRMEHAYRVVQESYSRLTSNIAETVAGIRVTQGFAREPVNARLFQGLLLAHRRNNMRAAVIHGVYLPLFDLASQAVAAAILVLGAWRIGGGHMAVADLIGFMLYSAGFFGAAVALVDLYGTALQAMAGAERFFALLDTHPTIADLKHPLPLGGGARVFEGGGGTPATFDRSSGARITFDHVTFAYLEGTPVLRDISFNAEPGQTIALVGHTGSGKTSIVNLVCRLYEFQSGSITIDGRDLRSIPLAELHSYMALVSQDNFLFDGSVMDNIRFANPDASDEQVIGSCRALGCLDILEGLPQGLRTSVGERGGGLSLGQRQLVCFSRAMLADPRILILDEATSAVDTYTEHLIQRALERLMQGRTCLVVAHRLSTIRHADQILVLEHGRIVERGSHGQLMLEAGHYAKLYEEFIRLSNAAP